ncbi:hypothetical protein ACFL4T_03850 [candidate division KSB1 bacterium]
MGQQQLLLIVLGVIIVGIAVVVGIQMFGSSAASANYDAVVNDLTTFGANAQGWFKKPTSMGGGGRSFAAVTATVIGIPTSGSNTNGAYTIESVDPDYFVLQGVGVEDGDADGDMCTIQITVYADSIGSFTEVSR